MKRRRSSSAPVEWSAHTWPEIGAPTAAGLDAVLLPCGATEQHGPHLRRHGLAPCAASAPTVASHRRLVCRDARACCRPRGHPRERLDPGAPQEDNRYELPEAELAKRGICYLPRDPEKAVEASAADPSRDEDARPGPARRVRPLQNRRMARLPPDCQPGGDRSLRAPLLNAELELNHREHRGHRDGAEMPGIAKNAHSLRRRIL